MAGTETGKRRWVIGALIILLVMAWGLRMRGIEWPLLHPDEYKISSWATWMEEHSRTLSPSYPGGYFHLIKPVLLIKNAILDGGAAWQTFLGHGDLLTRPEMDQTFLLRKINVGLALLTVLVFYGLAFRVTRSRMGAFAAAAFLGLSGLHVQHSHYAETDIAMVFTLTLALYAWARVYERGQIGWFGVAAFLTGLAIGTKYTNLLLVPCWMAGLFYCFRAKPGGKPGRRLAGLILAGFLLVSAGFLYTNRHVLEGVEFWGNLQKACQSTYSERAGLLGQAGSDHHAALRSNWNTLIQNQADINPFWVLFFILGAGFVFCSRYRRYGWVSGIPLGLYVFYFLKVAPWVRGQEFMVFFPFAAVWIAIGVKESLDWSARRKHGILVASGVVACLLIACAYSGISALRCSSVFAMPEARVQALRWLYGHAPLQKRVGVEDYTVPACRLFNSADAIGQIEWLTPEQRAQLPLDYLLRNVSATGRGTVDPRTHELYPNYAANGLEFQKQASRLCVWGPELSRFAFAGNQLEWWETKRERPTITLASPLFRPIMINRLPCVTVPLTEGGAGSMSGLWVDTTRRDFVVGGITRARRTMYVVLQAEERAAEVVVNGMGDRHTVHLEPYDVAVVPVKRPWYMPRVSEYDVISIRARPQEHIRYFPCYAQVALDSRDVAMMLFQKGYADRALQWLAREPGPVGGEWLRYACAVEQQDWVLADSLEAAALRQRSELDEARGVSPEQLVLNGGTGTGYQDHSRLRWPLPDTGRNGVGMTLAPISLRMDMTEDKTKFSCFWKAPFRLAPGAYTIRGWVKSGSPVALVQPWKITVGDFCQKSVDSVTLESGDATEWIRRITVEREQDVTLVFESGQRGGEIEISAVEMRWNEDGFFSAELGVLNRAVKEHALHRQEGGMTSSGKGLGVFYPWVKLMKAEMVSGGILRLQFEALKDKAPPLKLIAYRKAFTGPKKFKETSLQTLGKGKGDSVVLEIPQPANTRLSEISLRVMADQKWVFAPLYVEGARDGRLWLKE